MLSKYFFELNKELEAIKKNFYDYKSTHPLSIEQFNKLKKKAIYFKDKYNEIQSLLIKEKQKYASDLKNKEKLFKKQLEKEIKEYKKGKKSNGQRFLNILYDKRPSFYANYFFNANFFHPFRCFGCR